MNLTRTEQEEFVKTFYWKTIDRKRQSKFIQSVRIMQRAFNVQLKEVLKAVEDSQNTSDISRGVEAAIDPDIMKEAIIKIYQLVGLAFAKSIYRAFKGKEEDIIIKQDEALEDAWAESMRAYITISGGEKIAGVSKETLKQIRKSLDKVAQLGLSIPEASKLIRSDWQGMSRMRSVRIARTEIIGASNRGAIIGAESTGIPMEKEWISTRDDRTRSEAFDHIEPDGQLQALNGRFNVSGEELEFPGDASGSPGNVINCRCSVAFKPIR